MLAIIILDLNIWCKPTHFPIFRPDVHTQWFKEEQSQQTINTRSTCERVDFLISPLPTWICSGRLQILWDGEPCLYFWVLHITCQPLSRHFLAISRTFSPVNYMLFQFIWSILWWQWHYINANFINLIYFDYGGSAN